MKKTEFTNYALRVIVHPTLMFETEQRRSSIELGFSMGRREA